MRRRGENCPKELIIKTEAECRKAASQFMDDDFVKNVGGRFSDAPNGCFWMVDGRSMKMSFNQESVPAGADPQSNSNYGGVCHAKGKDNFICFHDKGMIEHDLTT